MSEIERKLLGIIKENVEGAKNMELSLETDLKDLNINSLNFLKLIVEIEEAFDIEFDDDEINYELIGNIASITSKIEEKL